MSTEEIYQKCAELANCPAILGELERDLRLLGFAGSADIPMLIYLCLQTRRFKWPVSLVIKGPSGSGKSFALTSTLKFLPRCTFEYFGGMSEKAILYSGLDLQHKHLIIGEAAGLSTDPGRAFLRQLISEGEIRYMTVQSTDKGIHGMELPPIKGPCGLVMTTTANALHPEDESRMLTVHMRESSEQIRLSLLAQARGPSSTKSPNFEKWHALDEFISSRSISVAIPFAERLAETLPTTHFRVQRDFPQVLSLIQAHALLHKCNRPCTAEGEVVATLDDYSAVYGLVNDPISQGLEAAVPDNIRAVVEVVASLTSDGIEKSVYPFDVQGVSQREVADKLGRDQSVISRTVHAAIDQSYLANLNPGQGREAKLVLGERELPRGYVLPQPDDLKLAA